MRTSKISRVVSHVEYDPVVYDPVNKVFMNVDGETVIVAQDQRVILGASRVNDFKIQTMLDAGISREELAHRGCSLVHLDPFDVVEQFEKQNLEHE